MSVYISYITPISLYILCCIDKYFLVRLSRALCAIGLVRSLCGGLCGRLVRLACAVAYAEWFSWLFSWFCFGLCGGLCAISRWLMAGRLMVHKPLRKLFARRNCLCGLWCVLGLLRERLRLAYAKISVMEILFDATQYIYIYMIAYLFIYVRPPIMG